MRMYLMDKLGNWHFVKECDCFCHEIYKHCRCDCDERGLAPERDIKPDLIYKLFTTCIVCNSNLLTTYCTENVCKACCENMKCPTRYKCKAYSIILEEMLKRYNKEFKKDGI